MASNIGITVFIAFGVFVLLTTNYTLQVAIRGFGSLTIVSIIIGLLFYPKFKAVYKSDDDLVEIQKFKIFMKAFIKLSKPISLNTKIDNELIQKQLLFHTKDIGVDNIKQLKISGKKSTYNINFECQFENLDRLSYQLITISPIIAMQTGVIDSLQDNSQFIQNITKLFKINNDNSDIKIIEFK